jgi:WD40 repeat protein
LSTRKNNILFCFLVSSNLNITLGVLNNAVYGVAFSSDHSFLASCTSASSLDIWNYSTTSWQFSSHLPNIGECEALIQLPNNQLAAGSDFNITIWSPLTDKTAPIKTLTGHAGIVYGLALSPNGTLLASASKDSFVKLWNYSSQTTALKTLTGHANEVRAVCFVSNEILASGSFDKTIKIWNVSSGN